MAPALKDSTGYGRGSSEWMTCKEILAAKHDRASLALLLIVYLTILLLHILGRHMRVYHRGLQVHMPG